MKLFRKFRDPTILKPQFQPLFNRVRFVDAMENDPDMASLKARIEELIDFISALEMESFYSKHIKKLIEPPNYAYSINLDDPSSMRRVNMAAMQHAKEHRAKLQQIREEIYDLVIELLRFQKW